MSDKKADLLGLAPYGEALHTLTKGAVDGAAAFLGRICLPAAEEFGLFLQDKVHGWRLRNSVQVMKVAEDRVNASGRMDVQAHPRLVHEIVNQGSWTDDEGLQEMWGGLLASSCTPGGRDEENYLFVTILQQLTSSEARILRFACTNAPKVMTKGGLTVSDGFYPSLADVIAASGVHDVHRLDRELDHLRALNLISGGFHFESPLSAHETFPLAPTALGLNLYVRCEGSRQSPSEYFGLK